MARLIKGLDTKLIHSGEPEPLIGGAVTMPIFQSSTFEYAGQTSYHDLRYIRLNNTPNHAVLHAKLAALENAEAALVAALSEFSSRGINLSRIESRPLRSQLGRYFFFVDADGKLDDEPVAAAVEALRGKAESVRILGSYPLV